MTPILGHDVSVAMWVSERVGQNFAPPFTAIGFGNRGGIAAGAVFNDYVPYGNIELTLAADRPFTRSMLRTLAAYVFGQLGCSRLTVRTRQDNENVCNMAKRFGFVREATLKDYYGTDQNAELFRLLRKDVKGWLH